MTTSSFHPKPAHDAAVAPRQSAWLPAPKTPGFDELLRQYRDAGLPMVGVGSWGPAAPQTRAASPDAPTTEQLDKDMKRLATTQWGWVAIHQPLSGFAAVMTSESRREQERRRRLGREQLEAWDAGRSFAACMWASYGHHILLQSDGEVAASLELRDRHDGSSAVLEVIARGDALWASLGAWPWSAFPDGHPPEAWWQDQRAFDALLSGMAAQAEEMAACLRRACYLISALSPS